LKLNTGRKTLTEPRNLLAVLFQFYFNFNPTLTREITVIRPNSVQFMAGSNHCPTLHRPGCPAADTRCNSIVRSITK